jgi:hypothetical protein
VTRRGPTASPDWYTIHRAALELGVAPSLIESNIRAGRIEAQTRSDARGKARTLIPAAEILRLRAHVEPPAPQQPATAAAARQREAPVHDNPVLAQQIRDGIAEAERGETVYRGSFARFLADDDEQ